MKKSVAYLRVFLVLICIWIAGCKTASTKVRKPPIKPAAEQKATTTKKEWTWIRKSSKPKDPKKPFDSGKGDEASEVAKDDTSKKSGSILSIFRSDDEKKTGKKTASDLPEMPQPNTIYQLQKGDGLIIALFSGTGRSKTQFEEKVDGDGNITLPLLNQIKAEGKTSSELEKELRNIYIAKGYYNDTLTVQIIIPEHRKFKIQGEVNAPGSYRLSPGMRLSEAIATARDFNEYANEKKIQIIRGEKKMEVNYKDIKSGTKSDQDILIEPNDLIFVPRTWY